MEKDSVGWLNTSIKPQKFTAGIKNPQFFFNSTKTTKSTNKKNRKIMKNIKIAYLIVKKQTTIELNLKIFPD